MTNPTAECWRLPHPDSITFIQDGSGLHVIGEEGRRPPTPEEVEKLSAFKKFLVVVAR